MTAKTKMCPFYAEVPGVWNNAGVFLNITEKDGTGLLKKIAFTIDIAFANDSDF